MVPERRWGLPYIFALLTCCTFLALSVFFIERMISQNEKTNVKYLYDMAQQNKKSIMKQVIGSWETLDGVATLIGDMALLDHEQTLSTIQRINNNNTFKRMGIIDLQGKGDLVDVNGKTYQNVDMSREPFFHEALAGKKVVSDTKKDPYSDGYVNYYAVPIRRHGELVGILCAANSSDVFSKIINASIFGGRGFAHIVKSNGDYVIRSRHKWADQEFNMQSMGTIEPEDMARALDDLAQGKLGLLKFMYRSEKLWGAYVPIGVNDWSIVVVAPISLLNENYRDTAVGSVAIIVLALVTFSLLLWQINSMAAKNRKKLENLAYIDQLTGYRNYTKFIIDAEKLRNPPHGRKFTFWYMDLINFKYFNDLFGYDKGDALLRRLADTLAAGLHDEEIFCRISADNFAGLMFYGAQEEIAARFGALLEQLDADETMSAHGYRNSVVAGFYLAKQESETLSVKDMLNRANMAQKSMKQTGSGNRFAFYSPAMHEQVIHAAEIEAHMQKALEDGEFQMYLQPKIDIQKNNRIAGAEALVRWISKEKGMISPGEFIPLFEKNGFVVQLDRYMLESACAWIRRSISSDREWNLRISVNVSRLGLLQSDFLDFYIGMKHRYEIPDGILELEFTESMALNNNELFGKTIRALKENGFICALDDFGAGYSSLNVLKDLPIDVLKLDMLFFRKGTKRERERIVIRNIVAMAKELDMETVSEGVELPDQVAFLKATGCDLVQGYVFAKPMPVGDFESLIGDDAKMPPL